MADGSIRVVTKLDNTALKQQIKELEKELGGIQKEKAKAEAAISKGRKKYDEEREIDKQFPAEFSHREDIDQRAAKELEPLIAKQDELNQKEQIYIQRIEAANAKLAEQASIADASKQVDRAVKAEGSVANVRTQAEYNSMLDQTRAKMAAIEDAAARVATETGLAKDEILEANPAYQKLHDIMEALNAKASEFGSESKKAGKDAADGLNKAKKEANGFATAISKGIKKVGRMVMAIFGIRAAYSAVRMAVNGYISTNEQLAGTIETLKIGFAQMLGPAIEFVINLIIKAISVVNAFIYALTGINLVAKINAAALDKQADATSGAGSSAAKAADQLAGFDEQNKLSDTSAGGGAAGGGGAGVALLPDGLDMELGNVAEKLKGILVLIGLCAAGFAAWKLTNWITGLKDSGKLASTLKDKLQKAAGIVMIIAGAFLLCKGYSDAWANGLDWENLAEILAGIALVVGGLALSCGSLAASIGLITGGIALIIAGVKDLIENGYSMEAVIAVTIGVLGTLIGVIWAFNASLLANPIVLIIEAIVLLVGAFTVLWNECEGFRQFFIDMWEAIKSAFNAVVEWISQACKDIAQFFIDAWEWIKEAWSAVGDFFAGVWQAICDAFNAVVEWFSNLFTNAWQAIKNAFSAVGNFFSGIWSTIKGAFSAVVDWFGDIFADAWDAVCDVFSAVGAFFTGIWEDIKSIFSKIGSAIGGAVSNAFSTAINWVLKAAIGIINGFISAINAVISVINYIPGVEISKIKKLEVPQLAKGGIVNNPGKGVHAIIGEAGKEAVLPLENNTEWMDILAEKIGSNVTIPIVLDGKKIATYVVDIQKKKAFAMNGG